MDQKTHTPESLQAFVDAALSEADERGTVLVSGMSTEEFLAVSNALSDSNLALDAARNAVRAAAGLPPDSALERLLRASDEIGEASLRRDDEI
jgi:hypothetical protein